LPAPVRVQLTNPAGQNDVTCVRGRTRTIACASVLDLPAGPTDEIFLLGPPKIPSITVDFIAILRCDGVCECRQDDPPERDEVLVLRQGEVLEPGRTVDVLYRPYHERTRLLISGETAGVIGPPERGRSG
jgi:hypothetical protein